MKKLNNLFTLLSALLLLGACEKDGDTYFLSSPEENELIASANSVVLTKETAKFYALSLAWTDQTLQVSDSRYQPTTVYKLPYRFHARKISPGRFWKRPKVEYQRRTLSPL